MAHPAGESESDAPRLNFDRRLKLEFHGSSVTSDAGLLPFRELDDVLGLMVIAGQTLADARTGRNGRHDLIGMLRQSVFGRLAGYEDVNDADRLGRDPAMRWIVGGRAATKQAASTSQMGRFETEWLANDANLVALADLGGRWIDRVHSRCPLNGIVLDMDSSVSETYGDQEGTAFNGHFACTCYHPLFVFNQFGDLERCALRSGNVHSAHGWKEVLEPVVARYRGKFKRQLHADTGPAGGNQALVVDRPAGKTRQNWCQGRAPWPLRYLPDGRGRGAEGIVPRDSAADRGTTTTATTSACVRRRWSCVQERLMGGVCPNASENGQISPRPPSGLPEVTVAVRITPLPCREPGKPRISKPVWDSSGESRFQWIAGELRRAMNACDTVKWPVTVPRGTT